MRPRLVEIGSNVFVMCVLKIIIHNAIQRDLRSADVFVDIAN